MRRLFITSLVLSILLMASIVSANGRWNTIKPEGGKKTKLLIDGKTRVYYHLTPGKSMTVNVSGDSKYRIITRADFGTSKSRETVYTYRVGFNDKRCKLYSEAARRDKKTRIKGQTKRIGESNILDINTDTDAHSMTIRLGKKAKKAVYFRIQAEKEEYGDKIDFVAITPSFYQETVGISTNEKVSNYYLIDDDGKLSVEINGPTTLRVLSRLIMDETMRGAIKFPVAVHEDGILKNTYFLSVKNSHVSVILDRPKLLPSRAEKFHVEVPRGRHRYSFSLPENERDAVLRFFIPEKHLGNKAD